MTQTSQDNIQTSTPLTSCQLFMFQPAEGVKECHLLLHATCVTDSFEAQAKHLMEHYEQLLAGELNEYKAVFKRIFLSDAANQTDFIFSHCSHVNECALSIVEQPPLDGSKVAMWVYLQTDVCCSQLANGLHQVDHSSYSHFWGGYANCNEGNSEQQTFTLLSSYANHLEEQGCSLKDNCIRTWFFVQNVDVNYAGVVKARNDIFATQDLTKHTHFITSTGIGGRHASPSTSVLLDTYAVKGITPEQMKFLYAPTHLNPTYEYGVSFERGTYVDYGDRRHVFISGTASIDNKGQVVHPGDIVRQTARMLENVEVLLAEADCTFNEVGHMLVYLRDVADYQVVRSIFAERFPNKPVVIMLAPVCRPGWLIEMECMAVKAQVNPNYAPL